MFTLRNLWVNVSVILQSPQGTIFAPFLSFLSKALKRSMNIWWQNCCLIAWSLTNSHCSDKDEGHTRETTKYTSSSLIEQERIEHVHMAFIITWSDQALFESRFAVHVMALNLFHEIRWVYFSSKYTNLGIIFDKTHPYL